MDNSTYQKVYAGGETETLAIKNAFNEKGILFIEKNNIESGLRGGFYGGNRGVELLVLEKDMQKAKETIEDVFSS